MAKDTITHFGLELRPRTRGYYLTRDNYATMTNKRSFGKDELFVQAVETNDAKLLRLYEGVYADSEGLVYTDGTCKRFLDDAMKNFDLNMTFFSKLDRTKFNHEIDMFVKKTEFMQIEDLRDYSCSGYYAMILDGYCQIYIGTANNIKDRIRQHWGGGKVRLDRLVCGCVTTSKLSIDSFRSLDTTRMLVFKSRYAYVSEDEFINFFSHDFICNRSSGGRFLGNDPFSIESFDRYKFRSFE